MKQFENAIIFGENIRFIKYEEADEGYPTITTAATEFFGWGAVVVSNSNYLNQVQTDLT